MCKFNYNILKLFLIICFYLHFYSKYSLAVTCYICNNCRWEDGELGECIHACQSINNSVGTLNKGCNSDLNASPTCIDRYNCTCTSDHCNGINKRLKVTKSRSSLTSERSMGSSFRNGFNSTSPGINLTTIVTKAMVTAVTLHPHTRTKAYRNYHTTGSSVGLNKSESPTTKIMTTLSSVVPSNENPRGMSITTPPCSVRIGDGTDTIFTGTSNQDQLTTTDTAHLKPTNKSINREILLEKTTFNTPIRTTGQSENGLTNIFINDNNGDDDADGDDDDAESGFKTTDKFDSTWLTSSSSSSSSSSQSSVDHKTKRLGQTFPSDTINRKIASSTSLLHRLSTTIHPSSLKHRHVGFMTRMRLSNDVTNINDDSSISTTSEIDQTKIKSSMNPELPKDYHNTTKEQSNHAHKILTSTSTFATDTIKISTKNNKNDTIKLPKSSPGQPVEDKLNEKPIHVENNENEKNDHVFTMWTVIGSVFVALVLVTLIIIFVILFRKNKTYAIN